MNAEIPIPKTTSRAAACRPQSMGFTLVEVLVSMVILLMMMLIITQVIGTAQRTWRQASSRLSQFREARTAFDTITRGLAQATINSYRSYDYGGPSGQPTSALQFPVGYTRTAELGIKMGPTNSIMTGLGAPNVTPGHAVLFQAPLGYTDDANFRTLDRLLCVRGYYVYFSDDVQYLPVGLTGRLESKSRFRLYEYQPTTETNMVFASTVSNPDGWTSIPTESAKANSRPVAENILTLIMAPSFTQASIGGGAVLLNQASKAESYTFNSYTDANKRYQLPSSIQVVMVAMDEESATRLAQQYGNSPPQLFPSRFASPATLSSDLKLVRESLLRQKVNFRIFTSTVTIPAAES
ncbi:MAG: Verru Chthon cassette protein [Verrucomicrobiaceae bacterium]|nr:Verru Chthon cassette protein [Verrucomicrobiaceae bacterium]